MGEVIEIRVLPIIRAEPSEGRRSEPLKIGDLNGERPKKHPPVRYDKRGRARFGQGQVWVEEDSLDLWVIVRLEPTERPLYPNDVVVARYAHGRMLKTVSIYPETEFRRKFEIWNLFVKGHKAAQLRSKTVGSANAGGLRRVLKIASR